MKATTHPLCQTTLGEKDKSWVGVWNDLFKGRLTSLVLLTTLVGFYIGLRGEMQYGLLIHTLLATALVACGAAALNQYLERDFDANMDRTKSRPIPSGRLQPDSVLLVGGLMSGLGLVYLALAVNLTTSLLGAITLSSYLFLYTPLKRITPLNTVIGAIPGALPPLMGWTAVRDEVSIGGWSLFAILFFWQLPHFLAIGWLYREDYARAGFVMLPVVDPEGNRIRWQAVSHTLGLFSISLFPVLLKLTGWIYLAGALALGGIFLWFAIRFSRQLTVMRARQLFFASVIYLPLLLGLMVLDKLK